MSRHALYFDITRQNGLVQSLINSARDYSSRFESAQLEWFALAPQVQYLDGAVVNVVASSVDVLEFLKTRMQSISDNDPELKSVHVFSDDNDLLSSIFRIAPKSVDIQPLLLSMLLPSPSKPAGVEKAALPSKMSYLEEAVVATKQILEANGCFSANTAILRSDLREHLRKFDKKFSKNSGHPNAKGLIRQIVDDGRKKKWLKATENSAWLCGEEPSSTAGQTAAKSEKIDKGKVRSEQFNKCMRDNRVYCPKRIRDYFSRALRALEGEKGALPCTIGQLVRRARSLAEQNAAQDNFNYRFWPVATDGMLELLVQSRCLYESENIYVKPGVHARGTTIVAVAPDMELKCELFLLELLIRKLKNITRHDRTSLVHALFKTGNQDNTLDDMHERLDALFFALRFRISEDSKGNLSVQDAGGTQ